MGALAKVEPVALPTNYPHPAALPVSRPMSPPVNFYEMGPVFQASKPSPQFLLVEGRGPRVTYSCSFLECNPGSRCLKLFSLFQESVYFSALLIKLS